MKPEQANWKPPIMSLGLRLGVQEALAELDAHPELWNQHTLRTERYQTPHKAVSDIWVRYNDFANLAADPVAFTQMPHISVWYPCVEVIPSVKELTEFVFRYVNGKTLGGALITKIPPGGEVLPHVDGGWHASHYEKFAVQLKGNKDQGFYFKDGQLHPEPGEVYTFDNSRLHWVKNDSNEDRMTLIICIRR